MRVMRVKVVKLKRSQACMKCGGGLAKGAEARSAGLADREKLSTEYTHLGCEPSDWKTAPGYLP